MDGGSDTGDWQVEKGFGARLVHLVLVCTKFKAMRSHRHTTQVDVREANPESRNVEP